jgi:PKD repeat protein
MPMRKLGLIAILAAMTALLAMGCGEDDPKPVVSRLYANETCGVAPLTVQFRGDAAGGTPGSDPTGGNNWLTMSWDFGDGTVENDGASVAYHRYTMPDTYTVTLTVEDDNGDQASRSVDIVILPDSLTIDAFAMLGDQPASLVETCQPVQLGITAETCGFDPIEDSYERFVFRWDVGGVIYDGPNPEFAFGAADIGEQVIYLQLEDPTRSVTRLDTLSLEVIESEGADLAISADWLLSPQGTESATLERDVPSWPDTLTFSVHLTNAGPAAAYDLHVDGNWPTYNRITYIEHATTDGTSNVVLNTDQVSGIVLLTDWDWYLEELPAGAEATLDMTFLIQTGGAGQSWQFPVTMDGYDCDLTPGANSVTPILRLISVP